VTSGRDKFPTDQGDQGDQRGERPKVGDTHSAAEAEPEAQPSTEPEGEPESPPEAPATSPDTGADPTAEATEDYEDRWRRALADLDNLRKRHRRELPVRLIEERKAVARAFLPVLDNIDLALRHTCSDPTAIVEGVRAIRDQALAVLAQLGYPRQDEAGVPFDPTRHEAVAVVPSTDGTPPGSVVSVVRPGYGGTTQQLRPASVAVASEPAD
jgi:molecular chaperone GrpE